VSTGTRNGKGKNWEWRGADLTKKIARGFHQNMKRAAIFLNGDIVLSLQGSSPSEAGEPPGLVTGTLSRSIGYQIIGKGLKTIARIGSGIGGKDDPGYGIHLEFGTMPHIIIAQDSAALAFPGKNGEMVFRESVVHPGIAERPFLRPSLKKPRNRQKIMRIFGRKIL